MIFGNLVFSFIIYSTEKGKRIELYEKKLVNINLKKIITISEISKIEFDPKIIPFKINIQLESGKIHTYNLKPFEYYLLDLAIINFFPKIQIKYIENTEEMKERRKFQRLNPKIKDSYSY